MEVAGEGVSWDSLFSVLGKSQSMNMGLMDTTREKGSGFWRWERGIVDEEKRWDLGRGEEGRENVCVDFGMIGNDGFDSSWSVERERRGGGGGGSRM